MAGDLRGLVADPDFATLPVDRQRALAVEADPDLGGLDRWGVDRILTKLAPDPFGFTETRHGLPSGSLKALHQLESSGGKHLRSPTGAEGPFQITKATGRAYGLPDDQWMDETAQLATAGNILADNLKRTKGDVREAFNLYAASQDRGWYADRILQTTGVDLGQPQPTATTTTRTTVPGSIPEAGGARVKRDLAAFPAGLAAIPRVLGNLVTTGHPEGLQDVLGVLAPLNIPADLAVGGPVEYATGSRRAGDAATAVTAIAGPPIVRGLLGAGRGLMESRRASALRSAARTSSAVEKATGAAITDAEGQIGQRLAATRDTIQGVNTDLRAASPYSAKQLRKLAKDDPAVSISPTGSVTRRTPTGQMGKTLAPVDQTAIPSGVSAASNAALGETGALRNASRAVRRAIAAHPHDPTKALSALTKAEARLGTKLPDAEKARLYQAILLHNNGAGLRPVLKAGMRDVIGQTLIGGNVGHAWAAYTLGQGLMQHLARDPAFALKFGDAIRLGPLGRTLSTAGRLGVVGASAAPRQLERR